jgi:tRNA modification GTPase
VRIGPELVNLLAVPVKQPFKLTASRDLTLRLAGASVRAMTDFTRETIFALSSGRGPAAIAVVRVSGARAGEALTALAGRIPAPRRAALVNVRGRDGEVLDQALALWFPGPHSETGEDVAELQLHGGRAVIAAVLAALAEVDGLRPAEAGEFTRRAFENGRLDLTEVEGLADLVMAETEGQRRLAYRQMTGALGARAEHWRHQLIQALALVEARIDFSDEADVPADLITPALQIARTLEGEIAAALADGRRGERLREGVVVAIAGPPNAGKSTVLNRIAKREAAIVSPYAGTTRDVIEVHLDLNGLPLTLLDTAGIRDTDDPVELEGVRRARARAASADLMLWVVDASVPADASPPAGERSVASPTIWVIHNKIDLVQGGISNEDKIQSISKNEDRLSTNNDLKNIVNKGFRERNDCKFIKDECEFVI